MPVRRLSLSAAARSDISGIGDALDDLARGDIVGIPVDIRPGIRKYLLLSHAIYSRTTADAIEILRILHQSMDVRRHL